MPALTQIPDHYVTEFSTNWEHLLQQKISRLKSYCNVDVINGKEKKYNQIDQTSMRLITSRSATTTSQDINLPARWIRQQGYDAVAIFDEFDDMLLGQVVLPSSETVQSQAMAYGRTCDLVLINALGGTAYTGPTGTTPVTLPVGQKILKDYTKANTTIGGSGWGPGNTTALGLTLDKLIKAKSILATNEVDDDDQLVLVYAQQQLDDLLNNVTQVSSRDYVDVKALIDGKIDTFMGFKFVRSQQLPHASSLRTIYAYAKSGVTLSDAGRKVHMDIRPDLNHSLQIRSVASLGATRREEGKVVSIDCAE